MNRLQNALRLLTCSLLASPLIGCGVKPPSATGTKPELQANFNRADEAKRQGRHEEALVEFTKIIELDPTNAVGYLRRGLLLAELGRHREAIDDYTKAVAIDSKLDSALCRRADSWRELKEVERAIADYDSALRINPSRWDALTSRGYLRLSQGELDKAMEDFDAVIRADDNEIAYRGRGLVWEAKREWKKALADYEAAVRHRFIEDDTSPHHELIWVLATHPDDEVRNGKRALELAEEAVAIDGSSDSYAHLAAALAEVGRFKDAIAAQQKALDDKSLPADKRPDMEQRMKTLKAGMPIRSE